ncbi:MAG: hypothetical protein ACQCN6_13735 [Candidatus Bathyarchaeia archaeon]|jgi:hypothetical protein
MKRQYIKKIWPILLAFFLLLPCLQLASGFASGTNDSDEVLLFLSDVASLDLTKYEIIHNGEVSNNMPTLNGLLQITGKYTLKSEQNTLEVLYKFINGTLTYCLIDSITGTPQCTQPKLATTGENAERFLEKYQAYSNDPDIETYRNMLKDVDTEKNSSQTMNSLKLSTTNSIISSVDWRDSFNGADYTGLSVSFKNGFFYAFKDDRSYYTIGGTEVEVSQEEAIDIALKYVENFSWKIGESEVYDFNIVHDHIRAELLTKSREPLYLYPYWLITLPLDDIYPGLVTTIQVQIWADTSEIIRCDAIPTGGGVPYDKLLETQQMADAQPSPLNLTTVGIAGAIITALLLTVVIIKKKK